MRPIRRGDRGPAVEDVQRRLLILGHPLGTTGIDGVFLEDTLTAVREFQRQSGLDEDGIVGQTTWAALVDATFALGDRLLYLRFPYLHGHDVEVLQQILNTLGFACGQSDGIFGAFTERAVREFQSNTGQPADGIAGSDTVRALMALRHLWEGKSSEAVAASKVAPARAAEVLGRIELVAAWADAAGEDVAGRLANLAVAAQPSASVEVLPLSGVVGDRADVTLVIGASLGPDSLMEGVPVVAAQPDHDPSLVTRALAALMAVQPPSRTVCVDVSAVARDDEHRSQAVAVALLDAVCARLA